MVEAYWSVAKEGGSIAIREWAGVCRSTAIVERVWQYCSRVSV